MLASDTLRTQWPGHRRGPVLHVPVSAECSPFLRKVCLAEKKPQGPERPGDRLLATQHPQPWVQALPGCGT